MLYFDFCDKFETFQQTGIIDPDEYFSGRGLLASMRLAVSFLSTISHTWSNKSCRILSIRLLIIEKIKLGKDKKCFFVNLD